jgi:hypothetical protein
MADACRSIVVGATTGALDEAMRTNTPELGDRDGWQSAFYEVAPCESSDFPVLGPRQPGMTAPNTLWTLKPPHAQPVSTALRDSLARPREPAPPWSDATPQHSMIRP